MLPIIAYRDLQGSLRGWIARVSPQNAQDLQNANDAYSRMLRINNAAGRNINGEFTPQNLAAASKLYSSTPQYAAGGALMQGQAQDAYNKNQALTQAGRVLRTPGGGHEIGPQVLFANLLEHALDRLSLGAATGLGAAVGLPLAAAYSTPGREFINSLLASPSLGYAPAASGYASGLLPPTSQAQGQ